MGTVNWRVGAATQTEAQWTSENPILLAGETAVSSDRVYTGTDQRKFKMGNGTDRWNDLDYMPVGGGSGSATWGTITGTLSNQTDLDNALDALAASISSITLEDVRSNDSEISGIINHANGLGVLDLSDSSPGNSSASLSTPNGIVYVNNTQVYIGDTSQTTGIYANTVAGDVGLQNANGIIKLNVDGTVSVALKKVVDVANGVDPTDAVNKSQLDGKASTETGTYRPVNRGFSSQPTYAVPAQYSKSGNIVTVGINPSNATSNSITTSIFLPFTTALNYSGEYSARVTDSGTLQTNAGYCLLSANSNIVSCARTLASAAFAATGNKRVGASFSYVAGTNDKRLIFWGDSISNYGNGNIANQFEYPINVYNTLTGARPAILPYAIGGKRVSQLITDFNTDILPNIIPGKTVIVLMCGINDLNDSVAVNTVANNLVSLCQTCESAGAILIHVMSIPGFNSTVANNALSLAANCMARPAYCTARVDPTQNADFNSAASITNTSIYNVDQTHLVTAGYTSLANIVYPTVQTYV